jgi:hypothetical protein
MRVCAKFEYLLGLYQCKTWSKNRYFTMGDYGKLRASAVGKEYARRRCTARRDRGQVVVQQYSKRKIPWDGSRALLDAIAPFPVVPVSWVRGRLGFTWDVQATEF